ncbi:DUF1315 family protein [Candidatus Symbiopectobacterium sp.]|uniref:YeaC family protein n=1 Tax=Candidatus Symbiopectobacterium sp. TaxID=2816440 RepID=UPI0025BA6C90|nr:DUF1315 family protein [Candidatus Symbiopectobacterium sp.]
MLDKQLDEVVTALTPDIYQLLATAVELGKWTDGVPLTLEQKENCLKIVMLWQSRHNVDAEHMTINTDGELVMKSKQELKQAFVIDNLIQRERQ